MTKPSRRRLHRLHERMRARMPVPPSRPQGVADRSAIRIISYDARRFEEKTVDSATEIKLPSGDGVAWIDVENLGDPKTLDQLGSVFGLHGLAMEDVLHVHQRPKIDDYGDYSFVILRIPIAGESPATEQIAMFVGKGWLLTFGHRPGDCFDAVRAALRAEGARVRERGADYLAYTLIDAAIDSYFPLLEAYGEDIEKVETEIFHSKNGAIVERIHDLKQDLLALRRVIWSHREIANKIVRDASPIFSEKTRIFVRDCYDHSVQQIDIIETYRDVSFGLLEIYQTEITTRLNEIMKVLTIISTIFIPLTFIAGVYGMNFGNMPELRWHWGYFYSLGLMTAVALGLVYFFHRRGWFGSPRD